MAEIKDMNIFQKIMCLRQEVQNSNLKQSGYNKFQNYKYWTLSDIIPVTRYFCLKYNLYTDVQIGMYIGDRRYAVLQVINMDNTKELVNYRLLLPEFNKEEYNKRLEAVSVKDADTQIKDLGKLETYCRRYLYFLFLDLPEQDLVDNGKPNKPKPKTKTKLNNSNFNYKKSTVKKEDGTEYEVHDMAPKEVQVEDPEPIQSIYNSLVNELESEGSQITKSNLRVKASALKREDKITAKQLKAVIEFINTTEGLEP